MRFAPRGQGLFDLSQRLSLNFHRQPARTAALDGRRNRAGGRDVVVLDENHVVEPGAVIGAASAPDRVLLQSSPARGRLARVEDDGLGPADRIHEPPGCGGDARQPLDEVEGGALGGEDGPGPAMDLSQNLALSGIERRPSASARTGWSGRG